MPRGMPAKSLRPSLGENIDQRLGFYSAAATAAGVSLLALAVPAQGSVVVHQVNVSVTDASPAFIDLNTDGKNDFEFFISRGGYDHSFYRTLAIVPLTGGKAVGGARGSLGPYGSALASGANIGPSAHFSSSIGRGRVTLERTNGFVSGSSQYTPYGQWGVTGTTHFLGVKFLIGGAYHYGWIKMSVSRSGGFQGTITEYAYETVASQKIAAGATTASIAQTQPSREEAARMKTRGPSLGMLANGAGALSLWRRDESAAKPQPPTAHVAGE